MQLPHDCKMVARVGGTKCFIASIHKGQKRKQTSQVLSHCASSLCSAGAQVFPRPVAWECCVLIGLDQYSSRCSQTSSISNTRELVGSAVCQPHPATNSDAQDWDPDILLPYFNQDYFPDFQMEMGLASHEGTVTLGGQLMMWTDQCLKTMGAWPFWIPSALCPQLPHKTEFSHFVPAPLPASLSVACVLPCRLDTKESSVDYIQPQVLSLAQQARSPLGIA